MSEKPQLPPQECNPKTLGLARSPRPALKRKPETEVVVQLGPFTDGQITAPEMVRPLEGPTEWLIKPKTGEIVPHDAGTPPDKGVIRKYITVGAQDTDVPDDLPKISEGYVVERVNQTPLPSIDAIVNESEIKVVSYVQDRYDSGTITCEDPDTPVDQNEDEDPPTPPPPTPPVDQEEDPNVPDQPDDNCPGGDCDPPPPPPPCHDDCNPTPPDCKPCEPVDAINDFAETEKNKPVTIDVLKNDIGGGELTVESANATHGTVQIVDGKLLYTPNSGFTGPDVITYSMQNECGMEDTANVYVNVKGYPTPNPNPSDDCPITPVDCPINSGDGGYTHGGGKMHDYQYSSEYVSDIFSEHLSKVEQVMSEVQSNVQQQTGNSNWSSACYDASFNCSSAAAAPAEEHMATC